MYVISPTGHMEWLEAYTSGKLACQRGQTGQQYICCRSKHRTAVAMASTWASIRLKHKPGQFHLGLITQGSTLWILQSTLQSGHRACSKFRKFSLAHHLLKADMCSHLPLVFLSSYSGKTWDITCELRRSKVGSESQGNGKSYIHTQSCSLHNQWKN